jgi:hypothetical protein
MTKEEFGSPNYWANVMKDGSIQAAVSVLRVQPGDVVVVSLPGDPTQSVCNHVAEFFRKKLPGQEVIVCGTEVNIAVLRAGEPVQADPAPSVVVEAK